MNLKRTAISIGILFHLFAIAFMPNRLSWFSTWAAPLFTPYLEFFEFTANWNFFAPEPGPPPLRIEWETLGRSGEELGSGVFPDTREKSFFSDRFNRRMAIARFLSIHPEIYLKVWPQYLCGLDPKMTSVRLWTTVYEVPTLEQVRQGERRIFEPEIAERKSIGQVFCEEVTGRERDKR